jgi:hypothetical protein
MSKHNKSIPVSSKFNFEIVPREVCKRMRTRSPLQQEYLAQLKSALKSLDANNCVKIPVKELQNLFGWLPNISMGTAIRRAIKREMGLSDTFVGNLIVFSSKRGNEITHWVVALRS